MTENKYFDLRIQLGPKLHKDIANIAANKGMKIKEYVRHCLRITVDNTDEKLKRDYVE